MVLPSGRNMEQPEDIQSLSQDDLNKMRKDELQKALTTMIEDSRNKAQNVGSQTKIEKRLDELLSEFRLFRDTHQQLQKKVDALKEENTCLRESVMQHQRYLEALEAERRGRNMIFLGVPESDMKVKDSHGQDVVIKEDQEKVESILQIMGHGGITLKEIQRLGNPSSIRNRVLLVSTESKSVRDQVIRATSVLKEAGRGHEKVYVKKDIHPLIRKEFNRLKDVEKREKEKPENQGLDVRYDGSRREVIVDGKVVDYFRPMFFA